ncbi:MAG: twin-arginine translocase subunit TatC [Hyphomicrobiales bacterium]|nr:twin-arginine translocase subunit TatC [Hyphomicrobiales bacterium]MBV9051466.1 twin-arginine translocase subunit TatC [Hyphomicrobiales bacterium]MBV9591017.1 twin-arginine translocase subunit TatC [Hyphomicrobiales bacterium]MBV9973849.1 twin-arginine translocase subunit TatC [Hyphomicrobiales bacterium]
MNDVVEEAHIEASRAPLIEHLIELRTRLIRSLLAFAVLFVLSFVFATQIYNILLIPYVWAASQHGYPVPHLVFTEPLGFLITKIKLAAFAAAFLAFPVIATQVYKFVAPGLYKKEQRAFFPYLIATPILFLVGAGVVFFLGMPAVMYYSLSMQQTGGDGTPSIELLAKVDSYLSLLMTLIFAFGICFQTPVILTILARVGFIDSAFLKRQRRYAIVVIFCIAAVLAPPDAFSMLALALPTLILYEGSIIAVSMIERKTAEAREQASKS